MNNKIKNKKGGSDCNCDTENNALFQMGGDGYSVNPSEIIAGMPTYPRYSNNYRPIFDGQLLNDNTSSDKFIYDNTTSDKYIYDMVIQNGGVKKKN